MELLQRYARKFFPSTRNLDNALRVEAYTLTKAANLVMNVDVRPPPAPPLPQRARAQGSGRTTLRVVPNVWAPARLLPDPRLRRGPLLGRHREPSARRAHGGACSARKPPHVRVVG